MTHRENVIRLAEAYIKAGQSIEADKIIKIADYFMAHTNDYTGYNTGVSWTTAINNGSIPSLLYRSSVTSDVAESKAASITNKELNKALTPEVIAL